MSAFVIRTITHSVMERHLPAESAAADGGDINDVVVSLRLELHLERVPYLPQ
jgi:hypothetical protein